MAAEVLEPIYKDMGEWRKLIAVLEVKLRHSDDELQQVELLHQIAELLESDMHLDVPEESFDAYARALAVDLLNEITLERLDTLADQTGRWEDLARLFDQQLEDIVEADHAIPIGLRGCLKTRPLARE